MDKHEELIKTFYNAFSKHDFRAMQKCYHDEVEFFDPVFQNLNNKKVKAMWHMLCENGKDLQIDFGNIGIFDSSAKVTWNAVYTFSKSGKIVHNKIEANFHFKDGLIIQHTDEFDLWHWARMALGLPGILLGWSGLMQNKIRHMAGKQLEHFLKGHPEYS